MPTVLPLHRIRVCSWNKLLLRLYRSWTKQCLEIDRRHPAAIHSAQLFESPIFLWASSLLHRSTEVSCIFPNPCSSPPPERGHRSCVARLSPMSPHRRELGYREKWWLQKTANRPSPSLSLCAVVTLVRLANVIFARSALKSRTHCVLSRSTLTLLGGGICRWASVSMILL